MPTLSRPEDVRRRWTSSVCEASATTATSARRSMLMPKTTAQMLRASTKQRRRCVNFAREPLEVSAQGGGRASLALCTGETTHDGPHETGDAEWMCRQMARQRRE